MTLDQRFSGKPGRDDREQIHRQLRCRLKETIRRSKKICFKQLYDHAYINPWDEAYRIVIKRLPRPPQVTCPKKIVVAFLSSGKQKLVVLPKPNKPPGHPASYRSIYLLDAMGKMTKRVLYNKLLAIVESRNELSERQYGV